MTKWSIHFTFFFKQDIPFKHATVKVNCQRDLLKYSKNN